MTPSDIGKAYDKNAEFLMAIDSIGRRDLKLIERRCESYLIEVGCWRSGVDLAVGSSNC